MNNQTSLVLLEYPNDIVLLHKYPLALDQIGILWQLSILSHFQLVERLQLNIHCLLPLGPVMTTHCLCNLVGIKIVVVLS